MQKLQWISPYPGRVVYVPTIELIMRNFDAALGNELRTKGLEDMPQDVSPALAHIYMRKSIESLNYWGSVLAQELD